MWDSRRLESFSKLKSLVTSLRLPVLLYYDINNETLVSADASSYSIVSVLLQYVDGKSHLIAFASCSPSPIERRYAQIEKESSALTWKCENFRKFLIGTSVKIQTDHEPLISLFGNKNFSDLSPRIQKFRMRIHR